MCLNRITSFISVTTILGVDDARYALRLAVWCDGPTDNPKASRENLSEHARLLGWFIRCTGGNAWQGIARIVRTAAWAKQTYHIRKPWQRKQARVTTPALKEGNKHGPELMQAPLQGTAKPGRQGRRTPSLGWESALYHALPRVL